MGMLVKAVVLLDVDDVSDWESAYGVAFGLGRGRAIYGPNGGSARLREVRDVESYILPPCANCNKTIKEGCAWERLPTTGKIVHSGCVTANDRVTNET